MNFKTDIPIYRQIINYAFSCILSGAWMPGEKIPSVRELAVQMAVNTHTVLKAFDYLQLHNLIVSRRGMGYYLADDAKNRVQEIRREEFFNTRLKELFSEMEMLGISIDEVVCRYNQRN
ncbi:MAG: GntR family transcriptional regulator [Firmicutes bacterium]|nr:GntR family transcriptional regulator [Bacillota bacterium]MCM1401806.1 GntR family transcriptional regulator [Bacteroides sp.]MCM1477687.1 GntR family transcriptional regulator [Bacteroides sp.]